MFILRFISEKRGIFVGVKRLSAKLNPFSFILIGLLLLFTIIAATITPDPKTFFGNAIRLQGVFLFWHLLVFAVISADIHFDHPHRLLYSFFPIALFVFTLLTLFTGITQNNRAVATLGEPNSLAAVAVFFCSFVLFKGGIWEKTTILIMTVIVVLLSGSRSGMGALFLELMFIFLSREKWLGPVKALSVCLVVFAVLMFFPFLEGGGWFENRAEIWGTAFYAGLQSPILGNGFGNIQDSLNKSSKLLNNNVQYQIVDSSHNIFLDFWVQGGIWGFSVFSLLVLTSLYRLARRGERIFVALVLGLLVSLSFNPLTIAPIIMFWWVLGKSLERG